MDDKYIKIYKYIKSKNINGYPLEIYDSEFHRKVIIYKRFRLYKMTIIDDAEEFEYCSYYSNIKPHILRHYTHNISNELNKITMLKNLVFNNDVKDIVKDLSKNLNENLNGIRKLYSDVKIILLKTLLKCTFIGRLKILTLNKNLKNYSVKNVNDLLLRIENKIDEDDDYYFKMGDFKGLNIVNLTKKEIYKLDISSYIV